MKNSYEFSLYYSTFKSGIHLRHFSKQSYLQSSTPNYLKDSIKRIMTDRQTWANVGTL